MASSIMYLEEKLIHETNPRARILLLLELAETIKRSNPKQALARSIEAKSLIESIQDNILLGKCLFEIASAEFWLSDFEHAIDNGKIALYIFQKESKNKELSDTYNLLAMLNQRVKKNSEALEYYQHALRIEKELCNYSNQACILSNIGAMYRECGDYVNASLVLFEGLKLARMTNHSFFESGILSNIATVYAQTSDYSNALYYQLESIKIQEELQDFRGISYSLNNVGYFYVNMGDVLTALDYFFRVLEFAKSHNDTHLQALALQNIASAYELEGSISNALKYFKESLTLKKEIGDHDGIARVYLGLGFIFERLSDLKNARLNFIQSNQIAKEFNIPEIIYQTELLIIKTQHTYDFENDTAALKTVIPFAERVGDKKLLKDAHHLFCKIYSQFGKHKEATIHQKLSRYYKSQIYGNEQVENFRALAIQLEIEAALKDSNGLIDESLLRKNAEKNAAKLGDPHPEGAATLFIGSKIVIKTFGEFELIINGRKLTKDQWQRKKARDLFKYLLIHLGKAIPADELCDQLWNDLPTESALNNLNTTVSALRKALEPSLETYKPSVFLKHTDKSYKLELGNDACIDFIEFKQQTDLARKQTDILLKAAYYQAASELYKGEFLPENLTDEWTYYERESLKDQYIESQLFLSQEAFQAKTYERAIIHAKNILPLDRTFEKAYQLIFKAQIETHQELELKKFYKECEQAFKKELGIEPPKSLRDLVK